MTLDQVKRFTFRGLLAAHAIRDLQGAGLLRTPAATPDERHDQDLFAPVGEIIRNSSSQMQRYYRLLFVFENAVREFITSRFGEVDGDDWFQKRATSDMRKKVESRKAAEEKNQWHPGRNDYPIFYLDFGDLGLLIINHWDLFRDFFPNQAWVTSRISEGERTRNVIAHTNVLAVEEGDRLELYLRDWLAQAG